MSLTHSKTKLKNGVEFDYIYKKDSPLALYITFLAGSAFDPQGKEGLAHITEHLLMQKSKKYPNSNSNRKQLRKLGSYFNAGTGDTTVTYTLVTGVKKDLDKAIDIFINPIIDPLIKKVDLEKEKNIVLAELSNSISDPERYLNTILFHEQYFEGTPMQRPILGTKKAISSFTLKDFKDFHRNMYQNGYFKVFAAGGVSFDTLTNHLNSSFSGFGKLNKNLLHQRLDIGKNVKDTKNVLIKPYKDLDSVYLSLGFRTTSMFNHKHANALVILKDVLGGFQSSILNDLIREELGLVYSISTYTGSFIDSGMFEIYTTVPKQNLNKVINQTLNQLEIIKKQGINPSDLKDVKVRLLNTLPFSLETSSSIGDSYSSSYFYGNTSTPFNVKTRINSVTNKDIIEVANKYFNKKDLKIGMCGDVASSDIKIDL
jgi:predicted Zn-dependent peptidase